MKQTIAHQNKLFAEIHRQMTSLEKQKGQFDGSTKPSPTPLAERKCYCCREYGHISPQCLSAVDDQARPSLPNLSKLAPN
ncbi:hypothetical protein BDV11DRAFT_199824 [Aspergillus similis]